MPNLEQSIVPCRLLKRLCVSEKHQSSILLLHMSCEMLDTYSFQTVQSKCNTIGAANCVSFGFGLLCKCNVLHNTHLAQFLIAFILSVFAKSVCTKKMKISLPEIIQCFLIEIAANDYCMFFFPKTSHFVIFPNDFYNHESMKNYIANAQ